MRVSKSPRHAINFFLFVAFDSRAPRMAAIISIDSFFDNEQC